MASEKPKKKNTDIAELIEVWAWDYFRRKADRKQKKLLEKEYVMLELDWKKVQFVHEPPAFEPEPPKPGEGTPMNNVLFHTTFTNKTSKPQCYTFKAERTTRSSCNVEVEESFTQGYEMSVKLATPESIFEANTGFHRELELTKCEGQTIEEELCWSVDNQLEVEGHTRAEAKLIIIEEEYSGRFSVKTKIKGRVRAVFTNIKDNNSFIKAFEGDVDEIIRLARDDKKITGTSVIVDGATRSVICTTKGACRFKYGLKQNVEVDQFSLDE